MTNNEANLLLTLLFFNNQIIAFISDIELAKQIKLTIPEMKKLYEN